MQWLDNNNKGKLTTAQAMRLADELKIPNLRAHYIERYVPYWFNEKPPCCAIGGASLVCGTKPKIEGNNVKNASDFVDINSTDWYDIKDAITSNPAVATSLREKQTVEHIIQDLYDNYGWTRTEIADWLEKCNMLKD